MAGIVAAKRKKAKNTVPRGTKKQGSGFRKNRPRFDQPQQA
jgi:hypothetical protein